MILLDFGTFGLLPRSPYPSHPLYSIAYCASISLSKTYNWQNVGVLDSTSRKV